jgi:hypothetical protein
MLDQVADAAAWLTKQTLAEATTPIIICQLVEVLTDEGRLRIGLSLKQTLKK